LPQELVPNRALVAYAVGLLTAVVVIWLQYRSRRLVRSVAVTLAGAAVALLVGFFWPWDVLRFWPRDTTQMPGTEAVSVDFGQASVSKRDNKGWVTLKFTLNGLPEDLMVLGGMMDVEFRWPDGTTVWRRAGLRTSRPVFPVRLLLNLQPAQADLATEEKRQQMQEAFRQRMLARRQAAQPSEPGSVSEMTSTLQIPLGLLAKFTSNSPTCTASLRLDGSRPALLMELPLKVGTSRKADGTRLKLVALEDTPASSPGQPVTQRMAMVVYSAPKDLIRVQFHLVDRTHGTETQLGYGGGNSLTPLPTLPLRVYRMPLPVKIPQVWRDEKWVGMPEWLEADTLAVVDLRKDGGFNRTLQTARLEFLAK
ncbi:MAG: hypothetical protein HYV75_04570, partial [Opitutae bacterium]|nr:hypothetical protein [Opitutae bacterium]